MDATSSKGLDKDKLSKRLSRKTSFHEVPEDGPLKRGCIQILTSSGFDYIMGAIIVFNLVVMVIETDRGARLDDEELTSGGLHWTEACSWSVLAVFVLELVARLIVFQCKFFKETGNIIDFVIVITDVLFSLIGLVGGEIFPVSVLRVFRLSKLARVGKVMKVFPELRMLLVGLIGSFKAIFWGMVLLALFLLVWSMVAVLLIHPLSKDIDYPDGCSRCPRAYSSVLQSGLTFWQQIVAGDSWGQSTIPIIEKHPITAFFFLPVFLSVGLSVMNLMLAVVVNLAQKAYEAEAEEEEAAKVVSKLEQESNIFEMVRALDEDKGGTLSYEEIYAGFRNEGECRDSMLALGISEDDFGIAWSTLDLDNTGEVSYQDFITFLITMKSSDLHFTLAYIKNYVTWMKKQLEKQMEQNRRDSMRFEGKLQAALEKIDKDIEAHEHADGAAVRKLHSSPAQDQVATSDQMHDSHFPKIWVQDGDSLRQPGVDSLHTPLAPEGTLHTPRPPSDIFSTPRAPEGERHPRLSSVLAETWRHLGFESDREPENVSRHLRWLPPASGDTGIDEPDLLCKSSSSGGSGGSGGSADEMSRLAASNIGDAAQDLIRQVGSEVNKMHREVKAMLYDMSYDLRRGAFSPRGANANGNDYFSKGMNDPLQMHQLGIDMTRMNAELRDILYELQFRVQQLTPAVTVPLFHSVRL